MLDDTLCCGIKLCSGAASPAAARRRDWSVGGAVTAEAGRLPVSSAAARARGVGMTKWRDRYDRTWVWRRLVARVSWARTASPVTLPPRNSDMSGLSVRALRP